MHRVAAFVLCLCLSGCGVGPVIVKSEALSYGDTLEDTTNKLLVLNILRARDKAPLHFAEIASIRVAIQQNAGLNLQEPIGPPHLASGPRNTLSGNISLQMAPSFELTNLVSKDFTTGIASPIDPKFVKYWLDRGLDRRIVLLLFFSSADIVGLDPDTKKPMTVRVSNTPRDAISQIRELTGRSDATEEMRCDRQSDFQRYLRLINAMTTFSAHAYVERRLVADDVKFDSKDLKTLQELATADPKKLQWQRNKETYSLYSISPEQKIALCVGRNLVDTGPQTRTSGENQACYNSVIEAQPETGERGASAELPRVHTAPLHPNQPTDYCAVYNSYLRSMSRPDAATAGELRLQIRSVGEIIQFLGDLLEYQDELAAFVAANPNSNLTLNDPVTFGFCKEDQNSHGCNDVFFVLQRDACNPRFSVSYRGENYSVGPYDPERSAGSCTPTMVRGDAPPNPKDHTLEVLAIVHQLVDLNKSANDLRLTPSVQVLP